MMGIIENDYVFLNGKSFPVAQVIAMEIALEVDFRYNVLLFFLGVLVGYSSIYLVDVEVLFYGAIIMTIGLLMFSVLYTRIRKVLKVHILNGGTFHFRIKERELEKAKLLIDKFRKLKLVKNTTVL